MWNKSTVAQYVIFKMWLTINTANLIQFLIIYERTTLVGWDFGDPISGLALHLTTGDLGQFNKPPCCVLRDERKSDEMVSKTSFYSKHFESTDLKSWKWHRINEKKEYFCFIFK